jgi:hypothetical protein
MTDGGWPALWLLGRRLVPLPVPDAAFGATVALDVNDTGQIVRQFGRQHISQRSVM